MEENLVQIIIKNILLALFISQFSMAFVIMVMGRVTWNFINFGITENPETRADKRTNILTLATSGIGWYLYKRLLNYNWFARKALMFVGVLVVGISFIIIYTIVMSVVKYLL
ncbi:hypothetical protein N781_15720 [Pontibacillus halophilus JSM 076056 = DSM 19796]|uniref:Uncharacterized protein n=1 Tax=Pontibacillus halophilus JSM 076056 = DSM 19796 TaxID=1385510 RepID=A0A0A5GNR3_9BACI|nr:hypothetical protein [Pontibacillus halophilus]KGX92810.1 hypothetical protein N781_15720 [Pontibacillus halophilus JSM 076056 = DSM 19796]